MNVLEQPFGYAPATPISTENVLILDTLASYGSITLLPNEQLFPLNTMDHARERLGKYLQHQGIPKTVIFRDPAWAGYLIRELSKFARRCSQREIDTILIQEVLNIQWEEATGNVDKFRKSTNSGLQEEINTLNSVLGTKLEIGWVIKKA